MESNHRVKQGGSHFVITVLTAAVLSTAISIILSMIIAAVVIDGAISEKVTCYFACGILLLAGFIGTIYGCRCIEGKYALICIANIAVFLFEQIAVNIVFFEGTFQKMGESIAAITVGGVLACCTYSVGKGRKIRRRVLYT